MDERHLSRGGSAYVERVVVLMGEEILLELEAAWLLEQRRVVNEC